MTIEEMKEAKAKAEAEIAAILANFQSVSGLAVQAVVVNQIDMTSISGSRFGPPVVRMHVMMP